MAENGLSNDAYTQYMKQDAFGGLGFGLTKGGLKDIGMGVDIAGTGHDLYSNLFGDKAKMFDMQMKAMKQNMANIKEDRAAHKAFQSNLGSGFNQAMGSGLAASSAATKL